MGCFTSTVPLSNHRYFFSGILHIDCWKALSHIIFPKIDIPSLPFYSTNMIRVYSYPIFCIYSMITCRMDKQKQSFICTLSTLNARRILQLALDPFFYNDQKGFAWNSWRKLSNEYEWIHNKHDITKTIVTVSPCSAP